METITPLRTPSPVEIRRILKVRGINAWEAFRCCVRSRNEVTRLLDFVADGLEFSKQVETGTCALVAPGSKVVPRLDEVCVPRRGPSPIPGGSGGILVVIGIVIAIADAIKVEVETSAQTQTELAAVIRKVANEVRTKTAKTCFDCIEEHMWGQSNTRKNYRRAEAADGSIEKRLLLRLGNLH